MKLAVEQVAAAFAKATPSQTADFDLLDMDGVALRAAHLAVSRRGFPALLIPVPHVGSDPTRLTPGLAFSAARSVEFIRGSDCRRCAAAVVECRESALLQTFSALVCAVLARLDAAPQPTWSSVSSLLSEWESLLGRRQILTRESELGLWGELWTIARTSRTPAMVEAWRGPDAEHVDFFLGDLGLEVKVGRRAGVHMVSQAQVDEALGDAPVVFMSMHVMIEPLRGLSIPDLVRDAADKLDDSTPFEETLARIGYSRDDEAAYNRRYVLLESPRFYRREDVPRVRAADPGVSNLRYRVELPRDGAMSVDARAPVIVALGLEHPFACEYPCA